MSVFKSPKVDLNKSPEYVFKILSDLRNLKNMMPEEVSEFEATEETCSFKMSGTPKLTLIVNNKTPYSKISFEAKDSPVPFFIHCNIKEISQEKSEIYLELNIELNMMMKIMLEKPLTNFLNVLSKKMKNI